MIKSDKEMTNNNMYQSNLLKPPVKCHICEYPILAILSERERYVLAMIRTQVKSKDSGQI